MPKKNRKTAAGRARAKGEKTKMAGLPILVVPKNATLRQIYAILRETFTAADLQKYTELDEGIPAETVLAELEAIQQAEERKLKWR